MQQVQKLFFVLLIVIMFGCASIAHDWNRTSQVNTIESYQSFLNRHPESQFTNEAKNRLSLLKEKQAEYARKVAEEKKRVLAVINNYNIGSTTYADFNRDKSAGLFEIGEMRYEQMWDAKGTQGTFATETVVLYGRPFCTLVFKINDFDFKQGVLNSIHFLK
jgi:outer membrane protein assembly factor BamD (BamD/ComL family)